MEKGNRMITTSLDIDGVGGFRFSITVDGMSITGLSPKETENIYKSLQELEGLFHAPDNEETIKSSEYTDPEFMQTVGMESQDIERWESEKLGTAIISDNGGRIELTKEEWYYTDKEMNPTVPSGENFLRIAACDELCETELCLTFTSKEDVRKLRNYLNEYLEK